MKLYSYWRSTTSVRVRIALNLKGVTYDLETVDLTKGAQKSPAFVSVNPSKSVPALVLDDGSVLTQSMAILDYLDRKFPEPPLLPTDPLTRARALAASNVIACDIHPVNNLRTLGYLKSEMGQSQDDCLVWMNHWMNEGFTAFQALIDQDGPFSFGDQITMADICLVGQMVNARRWGLDMTHFERLVDIDTRAREIDPIARAMPEAQPDAT